VARVLTAAHRDLLMNPECTPEIGTPACFACQNPKTPKVDVNRHCQAIWASQRTGCLLLNHITCLLTFSWV